MKGIVLAGGSSTRWISEDRMRELAQSILKNQYGQYLLKVIDELKMTGNPSL